MAAVHWYIARGGLKVGPFTAADLKQLATFGLLKPSEMLWTEGLSKWVAASTFPALFPAPAEKRYWLALAGKTRGPYAIDQIRAALGSRQVTLDTLAWRRGDPEHVAQDPRFAIAVYRAAIDNGTMGGIAYV